jgi:LemA protein
VAEEAVVEVVDLAAAPVAVVVLQEVGDMVFTFIAAVICAAVVLWYLLTFNALVKARNAVDQAWSHIEVELTRRLDLIQNLVEVAKGYARYEADTFKEVVALRTQPHLFNDAKAANNMQPELTKAISQIMVLAENYPQLRADASFLNLQKELADTENRIAERRHTYNQTVNLYLNLVRSVPSNAVANIQNMPEKSFFDVPDESVAQVPVVKLS